MSNPAFDTPQPNPDAVPDMAFLVPLAFLGLERLASETAFCEPARCLIAPEFVQAAVQHEHHKWASLGSELFVKEATILASFAISHGVFNQSLFVKDDMLRLPLLRHLESSYEEQRKRVMEESRKLMAMEREMDKYRQKKGKDGLDDGEKDDDCTITTIDPSSPASEAPLIVEKRSSS